MIMGYYDETKNVEQYIQMAEGYDGQLLIEILLKYLRQKSTLLELGMGPGKDLLLLNEHFQVTGSDHSSVFVERFKKQHTTINVTQLDAVTMDINKTFDGIYSNKVLHHLTSDDLRTSFQRQSHILNDRGIVLHSFWYGEQEEEHHGLRFVYYTESSLREIIGSEYEIIDIQRYTEIDSNDSLCLVLRKNS
jgi:cyclopropane fatty-acyl-phospholipid synthase-like methyltransferase